MESRTESDHVYTTNWTLALGIILRFTSVLFRSSNSEGRGFDSQWCLSWSNELTTLDARFSDGVSYSDSLWLVVSVRCCIIKCVKGLGWVCLYGVNTRLCWCCSQNWVSVPVLQTDSDIRLNSLSLTLSLSRFLIFLFSVRHIHHPPHDRLLINWAEKHSLA